VRFIASFAFGLCWMMCAVACNDAEEAPAAVPAAEVAAPPARLAASADDDEEEIELMDGTDEAARIPLEEMDQAALETACFEGRQDACDRLGH